jgi:hypothetical protein
MTPRGRSRNPGSRRRGLLLALGGLVLLAAPAAVAASEEDSAARDAAAPAKTTAECDETLLNARDLRIYRGVNRFGRATLILTNLDDEGNLLQPAGERAYRPSPPRDRAADDEPAPRADREDAAAATETAPVRVSVRTDEGEERAADAGEIEVRSDAAGGTTIVININNNPPPAPAPPPPAVVTFPWGLYGGIAGAFRYPEHHHFLGYGHGVRSPSSFSALGLRASDRFVIPDAGEPR